MPAPTSLLVFGGRRPSGELLDLVIERGLVASGAAHPGRDAARLDARGLVLAPGLVDLQVNGAVGIDLTARPEGVWEVAAALPRFGVSAFLPTVVSAPGVTYRRALAALAAGPPRGWRGARPVGWHFEGPMLNPRRAGAHDPGHLRAPSLGVVEGWSRPAGVAMVTLAPELPGALDVTRALVARGVVVAAGHSEAGAEELAAAARAGLRYATHLFNAMGPLHHRSPGIVGAVLAGGPVVAGLIADGVHVDPRVVAIAWRALGPDRCTLVSDAAPALGIDGPGGSRRADGTLTGGTLGLDGAVRNLVAWAGCRPDEALAAVTGTPARLLGLPHLGALAPGVVGDVVLLDPDLRLIATVVAGQVIDDRRVRDPGTR